MNAEKQLPQDAREERAKDRVHDTIGAAEKTLKESVDKTECKIETKNLHFYYGDFKALNNVSLDIPSKRITAIVGASGSGKSTYLRLLNRMTDRIVGTKVEGQIKLDGQNIFDQDVNPVALRKRVGMVFQKPNPFPKSIYDNVAHGPRIHGIKDKQQLGALVERCLTQAALWDEVKDILKSAGDSLSGGQQQRLCIARALAVEPEVILMDEPCSALDPISTRKVEELMVELRQDYTIVIVTHSLQQAARASDFTAVFMMNDQHAGEVVEFGTTKQVFTQPKHDQTKAYVAGDFG